MEGNARYVFPVVMTSMIVFVVTATLTYINFGFRPDFTSRWMQSFVVGWPTASITAFIAGPTAHRLTRQLTTWIDRIA